MDSDFFHGIYGICDNTPCRDRPLIDIAKGLLQGGARVLQLRIKGNNLETKRYRTRIAREIKGLKGRFSFIFIINDDLKLALELGADGIHVGAGDPSVSACRNVVGPLRYVGYSAHSLGEAIRAEKEGADYVAFGAVFPSPIKGPSHPVCGLDKLREVAGSVPIPVVAIGGITEKRAKSVIEAGASMVAAISALAGAPNVTIATRSMLTEFNSHFKTG